MRLAGKLGRKLFSRAAGAGAGRIAGLRHETIDHPVEHHAVVETFAHQFLDALHVTRREVRPHRDDDVAVRGFQDQRILVTHEILPAAVAASVV